MDYSLLVGIQNVTERRVFRPAPQRGGGAPLRSSGASIGAVRDSVAASSVVVQAEGQQQCGPLGYSAATLEGPGNYRLGIIDPLQRWDLRKRLERLLKIVVRLRCAAKLKNGMSAVEPAEYARRFHLMVGMKLLGLSKDLVQRDWEEETRNRCYHQAQQQPLPLQRGGSERQGSWRGTAGEYSNKPVVRSDRMRAREG